MKKISKVILCGLLLVLFIITGCASGKEDNSAGATDNDNSAQPAEDGQNELSGQPAEGQEASDNQGAAAEQGASDNQDTSAGYEASEELSDEELDFFTDFLNKSENYGFLLSEYAAPTDVDLNEVFYCGAGISTWELMDEEMAAYEQEIGWPIETDVERLTTGQIDEFLLEKTGYSLNEMGRPLEWVYLEQYDVYVSQHGDTNYQSCTCISGKRTAGDVYEIRYQPEYGENDGIVTLRKDGGNYIFISNRKVYDPDLSGLSEDVIKQLEVFAENKDIWNMPDYDPQTFAYAVYDLDNDGRLELITTVCAGTGLYSENHFYHTDDNFTEIEELPQEYYEDYQEFDLCFYQDYDSGEPAYINYGVIYYPASDTAKNGAADSYTADGAYYITDGIVHSVVYRGTHLLWHDADTCEQTWYGADGSEITQEEWEKLYDDFYDGMVPATYYIRWNYIEPSDLEYASSRKILSVLAEGYKAGLHIGLQ